MIPQPDGSIMYESVYEMTYELFNAIGLAIAEGGYVYDQDTRKPLQFMGRKLKATVDPNVPCYAGQGEVMFDIINNIRLATMMFGYCIDKETASGEFASVAQYIEDVPNTKLTAESIKMVDGSVRSSGYYINKCLKYVDAIFLIYDCNVDLHNFDTML